MSLLQSVQLALQPYRQAKAWYLALSGGLDSSVLLHILAQLRKAEPLPPLTAIHVHHGLQKVADDWPAHCTQFCAALQVPLRLRSVRINQQSNLEEAARRARYEVFEQFLGPEDVLLTAQHQGDQAETLLFRLLRGAGVRGLAAMPRVRPLGQGRLVRPLISIERAQLEAYALKEGLTWVEDPSNQRLDFSRNYLRHSVLPELQRRWPKVQLSLARTAEHMAEAQGLLDELALQDLAGVRSKPEALAWLSLPSLALKPLADLSEARQRNLLRYWLAPWTTLPDAAHWAGWIGVRDAASDRQPFWRLAQGDVLRAEGHIWWLPHAWKKFSAAGLSSIKDLTEVQLLDNGVLQVQGFAGDTNVRIGYRQGGERLKYSVQGSFELKRLLNQSGIPAFVRPRLPLMFQGEEVVAVANLWAPAGCNLRWQPPGLS